MISVETDRTVRGGTTVKLTPAAQKFVLHWGEMGQAWGINRTMAQVHALLFVSPEALDAEEISRLLDVSRSNVSTSLRELITWGVVRRVHIIGDRRDRFEALKDVMETFRVIMAERKRREMDPTIALLETLRRRGQVGRPDRASTPASSSRRCSSSAGCSPPGTARSTASRPPRSRSSSGAGPGSPSCSRRRPSRRASRPRMTPRRRRSRTRRSRSSASIWRVELRRSADAASSRVGLGFSGAARAFDLRERLGVAVKTSSSR